MQARIRQSFNAAAGGYEDAMLIQPEVARWVMDALSWHHLTPQRVLDVGCGSGVLTRHVGAAFPDAELWAMDLAPAMCEATRRAYQALLDNGALPMAPLTVVEGNMEAPPVPDGSMDVVVSNLAMHWCLDPVQALSALKRCMAPGGVLLFSTLGPDTCRELVASWAAVDTYDHVNRFFDMHRWGDALLEAGFSDPVMDAHTVRVMLPDVRGVLRTFRGIGGSQVVSNNRPPGLMGRDAWQRFEAAYEGLRENEGLPVTYEVVMGQAWCQPTAPRRPQPSSRVASVPIEAVQGLKERR